MSSAQGLCEALCFRLLCNDSIIWGTFVWQPNTDVEREPLVELSPAHCFVLCPEKGCIVGGDKLHLGFIFGGFGSSPFGSWLKGSQAGAV